MYLNEIEEMNLEEGAFAVFVAGDRESVDEVPNDAIYWGQPTLETTEEKEVKKLLFTWEFDPNKILVAQGTPVGPLITFYGGW